MVQLRHSCFRGMFMPQSLQFFCPLHLHLSARLFVSSPLPLISFVACPIRSLVSVPPPSVGGSLVWFLTCPAPRPRPGSTRKGKHFDGRFFTVRAHHRLPHSVLRRQYPVPTEAAQARVSSPNLVESMSTVLVPCTFDCLLSSRNLPR